MARQYKLARKMKKITLTVAAEDLGVSQPTLSAWESGRRSPTIEALIRMSEYYGVTVDFLLGKAKESDSRVDMTLPVSKEMLPALHEAPVYSPKNGWAFVDAVERQLRFATGLSLPFADVQDVYMLPPLFSTAAAPQHKPLSKA